MRGTSNTPQRLGLWPNRLPCIVKMGKFLGEVTLMKTLFISMAVIVFLLGMVSIVSAQGEGEDTTNSPNPVICCAVAGILILIGYGLLGYIKGNTKREGIVYIPNARYNNSSVYIKRVDDGRQSKEPDNRKKTGYW